MLLLGAVGFYGWQRESDEAPAAPWSFAWTAGATGAWRFEVASHVDMMAAQQATPTATDYVVRGQLALRLFAVDAERVRAGGQLGAVEVLVGGTPDPARARQLEAPFGLDFAPDGHLLAWQAPPGLGTEVWQQLQDLVSTFQMVVPGTTAAAWTATETHGNGRYRAEYERTGDRTLRKHKTAYLAAGGAFAAVPGGGVTVLAAEARARLHAGGPWLDSAQVQEELFLSAPGAAAVRARVTARLDRLGSELVATAALASASDREAMVAAARTAVAAAATPPASAAQVARFEALLAAIGGGDQDQGRLFDLARLLANSPELTSRLLQSLLAGGRDEGPVARLVLALEAAEAPHCDAALCRLTGPESGRDLDRLRAVMALGSARAAAPAVTDCLLAVAADRSSRAAADRADTALLALGRVAGALRTDEPARAAAATARLLDIARQAGDPQVRSVALKALGNSNDPALVDAVAQHLQAPEALERAAAAAALGHFEHPSTRQLLTQQLRGEGVPEVRAAVGEALLRLGAVPIEALDLVATHVEQETGSQARLALVRLLAANLPRHAASRAPLRRLVDQDPDANVRDAAMQALARTAEAPR